MIKKAIERHSYALARGIEELHQHTERMQTAFDEAMECLASHEVSLWVWLSKMFKNIKMAPSCG